MKFRPDDSMSERQLVLALAAGGRTVPLGQLVGWRKDGLLPPLASCGAGNGRSYYWRETDILAQAETVYDSLQQHGRVDAAIITLWLRGFRVPLAQLRRAWLHRARMRKAPDLRKAGRPVAATSGDGIADLLVGALMSLSRDIAWGGRMQAPVTSVMERALAKLGAGKAATASLEQFWPLVVLVASTLESSNLMRDAEDADLLRAQAGSGTILRFLETCCDRENPAEIVQCVGPALFLFALALIHGGQDAVLESLLGRIADMSRPRPAKPARAPRIEAALPG